MRLRLCKCSILLLFPLLALGGCTSDEGEAVVEAPVKQATPLKFSKTVVDSEAIGAAFAAVGDLNADGKLDFTISKFGKVAIPDLPPGEVSVYLQGDDLKTWVQEPIFGADEEIYWPNDMELHDIDGDGDLDALIGGGFLICPFSPTVGPCGSLIWFENTSVAWVRHDIVAGGADLFYHSGVFVDLDNDGIEDIVTVGEERIIVEGEVQDRAITQWFKGNNTASRFDTTPITIGAGLGGLISAYDIDADGDVDFLSSEFFTGLGGSFAWMEQVTAPTEANPNGEWTRHVIDDQVGPAIQFSMIPNLLGDGEIRFVGSNHTNTSKEDPDQWESAIYMYSVPADPKSSPWPKTKISEHIVSVAGAPGSNQAAPGIFGWGDAEGDGDIDIIVSGDGDPNLYLLEQSNGTFITHVFDENIPQAGGTKIVDFDGDGKSEILMTGYENNAVYLYNLDPNGQHPLRVATEATPVSEEPQDLVFEVQYEGTAEGNLVIGFFEAFPPTGPPAAFAQVESPTFPQEATVSGVLPGDYTVLVAIDVEPFNPAVQGPEDIFTTVEMSVPTDRTSIVIALDGEAPGLIEEPEPADLNVTVQYAGDELGQLVLAVFDELPPAGPPKAFLIVDVTEFPVTATIEDVRGGAGQVLAFLDLDPFNVQGAGSEDPQASSELFELDGEALDLELTLE